MSKYSLVLVNLHADIATEPNLGPLALCAAKPAYWSEESSGFISNMPRSMGSSSSKDLTFLMTFREGFYFIYKTFWCGLFWGLCDSIAPFYVSVFWLWGMWDLSSPTRDGPCIPTLESKVITTEPPRKSLRKDFDGSVWSEDSKREDVWLSSDWLVVG